MSTSSRLLHVFTYKTLFHHHYQSSSIAQQISICSLDIPTFVFATTDVLQYAGIIIAGLHGYTQVSTKILVP